MCPLSPLTCPIVQGVSSVCWAMARPLLLLLLLLGSSLAEYVWTGEEWQWRDAGKAKKGILGYDYFEGSGPDDEDMLPDGDPPATPPTPEPFYDYYGTAVNHTAIRFTSI